MQEIVLIKGKEIFTDSIVISNGTGVGHRKVKDVIRAHKNELEKLGKLSAPYQAESTGGRPEEYYQLNEQQSTFIITLLKNTERVTAFKLELVRQFYAMRQLLQQKQTNIYKDTRSYQVDIRKRETDTIKEFVEYAKGQGSHNADRYYTSLSRLADKAAGIAERQMANMEQLGRLAMVEKIISCCILEGMVLMEPYKDIYQSCKQRLDQFQTIAYLK